MNIGDIIFNNLEYVVAGAGTIGALLFIKARGHKKISNDLTPMMIKMKRRQDALNKQSKGVI